MKKQIKIILLVIMMMTLIVGCKKKEANETYLVELKEKLKNVGIEVFTEGGWMNGGIKEDTYTLTLKELSKHNKINMEEYKNPNTNKECDAKESNIQFIVKEETTKDKTNYELKVNLVCD